MQRDWYEVLVLAARYWFALLGIVVVWRGFSWLRLESRQRKRKLRQLPDAGFIGAFYVLEGESRALRGGDSIPVPMEGVIGSASGCDIRVHHPSVAGRQALFEFRSDGMHLRPFRDEPLRVDDQPLPPGCEAVLRHGALLTMGAVVLQLRLFAGIEHEMEKIDAPTYDPPAKVSKKKKSGGKQSRKGKAKAGSEAFSNDGFFEEDSFEEDPFGEDPFEEDRFGEDPFEEDRFGEDRFGEDRFGEDPFEEDSFDEERSEEERPEEEFPEAEFYFEKPPRYDDNPIYGNKKRRRR